MDFLSTPALQMSTKAGFFVIATMATMLGLFSTVQQSNLNFDSVGRLTGFVNPHETHTHNCLPPLVDLIRLFNATSAMSVAVQPTVTTFSAALTTMSDWPRMLSNRSHSEVKISRILTPTCGLYPDVATVSDGNHQSVETWVLCVVALVIGVCLMRLCTSLETGSGIAPEIHPVPPTINPVRIVVEAENPSLVDTIYGDMVMVPTSSPSAVLPVTVSTTELQAQLAAANQEIDRVNIEVVRQQRMSTNVAQQVAEMAEEATIFCRLLDEASQEKSKMILEADILCQQLHIQSRNHEMEISRMKDDSQAIEREHEKELEDLSDQLAESYVKETELKSEIEDLQTKLQTASDHASNLSNTNKALTTTCHRLKTQVQTARQEQSNLSTSLRDGMLHNQTLTSEISRLQGEAFQLQFSHAEQSDLLVLKIKELDRQDEILSRQDERLAIQDTKIAEQEEMMELFSGIDDEYMNHVQRTEDTAEILWSVIDVQDDTGKEKRNLGAVVDRVREEVQRLRGLVAEAEERTRQEVIQALKDREKEKTTANADPREVPLPEPHDGDMDLLENASSESDDGGIEALNTPLPDSDVEGKTLSDQRFSESCDDGGIDPSELALPESGDEDIEPSQIPLPDSNDGDRESFGAFLRDGDDEHINPSEIPLPENCDDGDEEDIASSTAHLPESND